MFRELKPPEGNGERWFIMAKHVRQWLTTIGTLDSPSSDSCSVAMDDFYYDSEADAHHAAAGYYKFFGKDYPYNTLGSVTLSINESQPMSFE